MVSPHDPNESTPHTFTVKHRGDYENSAITSLEPQKDGLDFQVEVDLPDGRSRFVGFYRNYDAAKQGGRAAYYEAAYRRQYTITCYWQRALAISIPFALVGVYHLLWFVLPR